METQLALGTDTAYENAKVIYQQGGHSKSFASIKLNTPLSASISKETIITGLTALGAGVSGKAYSDFNAGDIDIQVQYKTTNIQASYMTCQIEALLLVGKENLDRCLANTGTVTIGEVGKVGYSYNQTTPVV